MKYKLLKELPLAKAGTEVRIEWNSCTTSMIHSDKHYILWAILNTDIPEWLEEIKEPKTIYDLKIWDKYWELDFELNLNNNVRYANSRKLTHHCMFLTEREAKRNKLLRELATRTDKWLPSISDKYYSYNLNWCDSWSWQWDNTDMIKYHMWLVFRNEEEYNKYITEEAKDLLFNI